MLFSHRDDATRTAGYQITSEAPPVIVVEHTDAKGKTRKKTIKKKQLWQAREAAVRFLLNKEGYLLRAPQDGPIRWMARLFTDGYVGEIGHAVDPETGVVWVHDGDDRVHRITPETCATVSVSLGSGTRSPGCRIAIGADDSVWCAARSYERRGETLVPTMRVYRVQGTSELAVTPIADLVDPSLIGTLSSTRDGRLLGPAVGGAALYDTDGSVQRTYPCTPTEKGWSVAAISPGGEWVACSHVDHVVLEHLPSGEQTRLQADLEQLNDLQVTDDGTVYVSGFRYPSHGLWVLSDGEPERVSDDIRATVSADGGLAVQASYRQVMVRDLRQPRVPGAGESPIVARSMLWELGMAKYGKARFVGPREVSVLTDAYTVASIDLDRLGPPPSND